MGRYSFSGLIWGIQLLGRSHAVANTTVDNRKQAIVLGMYVCLDINVRLVLGNLYYNHRCHIFWLRNSWSANSRMFERPPCIGKTCVPHLSAMKRSTRA